MQMFMQKVLTDVNIYDIVYVWKRGFKMVRNYTAYINHKIRPIVLYGNEGAKLYIGGKYIRVDANKNITTNLKSLDKYQEEINYLKSLIA